MENEHCEGCSAYLKDFDSNHCAQYNTDGSCPCTECIIKIMCTSALCEKYLEWDKEAYEESS